MNRDKHVEWDDVYQTAWLGFMKASVKWKKGMGVTLGAYARTWVWGAVYRSILGSRARTNARLQIGYPVGNVTVQTDFQADIDLMDHIMAQPSPTREVVMMSAQGYKPREVAAELGLPLPVVSTLLREYGESLGQLFE